LTLALVAVPLVVAIEKLFSAEGAQASVQSDDLFLLFGVFAHTLNLEL